MTSKTLLSIALLSICLTAEADKDKASGSIGLDVGHDSNPFRFSDLLDKDTSLYHAIDARFRYDFTEQWRLSLRAKHVEYQDTEDASNSRLSASVRYRKTLKWLGHRWRYQSKLGVAHRDKTYISRFTGERGTIGTAPNEVSVPNRYDNLSYSLDNQIQLRVDKLNRVGLDLDFSQKDYEDYESPSVSNLDYDSHTLALFWTHRYQSKSRLKLWAGYRKRIYDDQRAEDLSGNDIVGSDLEYNSWIARASLSHRWTHSWRSQFSVQYEQRKDNEQGYDDSDRSRLSASLRWTGDQDQEWRSSLSYLDNRFPNRNNMANSGEDELDQENGLRIRTSYTYPFGHNDRYYWRLSAQWDKFESRIPQYEYERTQVSAGIGINF